MVEKYNKVHQSNIETIDEIIEAINRYLNYMLKVWDFRIKQNRSNAILSWKDKFVNCKVNLNQSYERISFQLQYLETLKSNYSPDHKADLKDLERLLPLIHNPVIEGYRNTVNFPGYSQDHIIDATMRHSLTIKEAVDKMFHIIEQSFFEYTKWIGELEKAKTANYTEMGLVEYLLMKENNALGRSLTEYINNQNFYNLSFSDAHGIFKLN